VKIKERRRESIKRLKQRIARFMWRTEDRWHRTAAYQAIDEWAAAERKRSTKVKP
jgi:hypothetical protein